MKRTREAPAPKPKSTYQQNEHGAWIPTDDPTSIARVMTADSRLYWFPVKSWTRTLTTGFGTDCDAVFKSDRGDTRRESLSLILDTERRRFHTIRAEGAEPIGGGFTVSVYPATAYEEEQTGGYIRHWPRRDGDDVDGDDVLGTLMVRDDTMLQLVEGLRGGMQVSLGLQLPIYKEAIAHSFDEHWMAQELYIPYGKNVVLDAFKVQVTEEPVAVSADDDGSSPVAHSDSFFPIAATGDAALHQRLNWGLLLLALIACILLVKL